MTDLSDYFSENELMCKGSHEVVLDPRFAKALFEYRHDFIPLIPNSCCRSIEYNEQIGGSNGSYHIYEDIGDGRLGCLAIDLYVKNDKQRVNMVERALNMDWSVGVYRRFIHIDRRVDLEKPQVCFWGAY